MAEVKVRVSAIPKLLEGKLGQEIITKDIARQMGQDAIDEMKDMISKGISPVREAGRFPGYLAAVSRRGAQKALTEARRSALEESGGSLRGASVLNRNAIEKKKAAVSKAGEGYPYSVMADFPDKRERPVNLYLTGEQMKDLTFRLVPGKWGQALEIGYFTALSAKKESGHREGVHGQPSRPTIPDAGSNESFAIRISRLLRESMIEAIDRYLKK